jgi:hypothetical protein
MGTFADSVGCHPTPSRSLSSFDKSRDFQHPNNKVSCKYSVNSLSALEKKKSIDNDEDLLVI